MPVHPVLFCLSGSLKGVTLTPQANPVVIGSDGDCVVRIPPSARRPVAPRHLELEDREGRWFIRSLTDAPVLLNDEPVMEAAIQQNDLVRLGQEGPLFRFRLSQARRPTKTFHQMVGDARDVVSADRPRATRATRMTVFARQLVKEAVANSTRRFQVALTVMGAVIIGLGVVLVKTMLDSQETVRVMDARHRADQEEGDRLLALLTQSRVEREDMERRLTDQARKLDDEIADELARLTVRSKKREAEMQDLSTKTQDVVARMSAAELQAGAAKRIHKDYHRGVCFIYVGISFYHPERKQFLRWVIDPKTGKPDPKVRVPVTLGGEGPKHMDWVSGSGFLIDKSGLVLSNRHVIDPWYEDDSFGSPLLDRGFRAVREVFIACFPGRVEPVPLQRMTVHEDQDIAVVRLVSVPDDLPVLPLSGPKNSLEAGMDVYVIGYPEGLSGLMQKLPTSTLKDLVNRSDDANHSLVKNLTQMKGIEPVFTKGALSSKSDTQLVYDAVTYNGGSGGPVFNEDQMVVGINTAISRNFTGANYGTPIRFARDLLKTLRDSGSKPAPLQEPELDRESALVEDK